MIARRSKICRLRAPDCEPRQAFPIFHMAMLERGNSMRWTSLLIVLTIVFGANILIAPVAGESMLDRARRDQIVMVPGDDPEMLAAMAKARATLQDFLALARAPRPSMSGFAVKVAVRDKGNTEYFWIAPFNEQVG